MQRICVYCGSKSGGDAAYATAASELGAAIAECGMGLVYGGGQIGLMGCIADSVLKNGGEVIGVIPTALAKVEVAHQHITELKVTDDMHARKALMMKLSDGFIALPGGLGTLEELCEVLAWAKLNFHRKPCALLNVNGFYDNLIAMFARTVADGFDKPKHRDTLIVETQPVKLLQRMLQS